MKDRLIPLLPEGSGMLGDWLEFRLEAGHGALSVERQGKPLTLNSLPRAFERLCWLTASSVRTQTALA